MRPLQVALLLTGHALLLITLAGLWWRDRLRRLWMLPVHLVSTLAAQSVALVVPHGWFTWGSWGSIELALHAITLGIVAEMTLRMFAMLPEERPRARRWIAAGLLVPLALLLLIPWEQHAGQTWLYVMVVEILPRLSFGAACVCLALQLAALQAHVVFDPLYRDVLWSLAGYLILYAVALGRQQGEGPLALVYLVTPLAYTLMLGWWAWAAWRTEKDPPEASPEAIAFLHPWRAPRR